MGFATDVNPYYSDADFRRREAEGSGLALRSSAAARPVSPKDAARTMRRICRMLRCRPEEVLRRFAELAADAGIEVGGNL